MRASPRSDRSGEYDGHPYPHQIASIAQRQRHYLEEVDSRSSSLLWRTKPSPGRPTLALTSVRCNLAAGRGQNSYAPTELCGSLGARAGRPEGVGPHTPGVFYDLTSPTFRSHISMVESPPVQRWIGVRFSLASPSFNRSPAERSAHQNAPSSRDRKPPRRMDRASGNP